MTREELRKEIDGLITFLCDHGNAGIVTDIIHVLTVMKTLREETERLDSLATCLCTRVEEASETIGYLRAESERLRAVVEAASGLARGTDWNKGTHALHYRPELLAALAALDQERKEGK